MQIVLFDFLNIKRFNDRGKNVLFFEKNHIFARVKTKIMAFLVGVGGMTLIVAVGAYLLLRAEKKRENQRLRVA
ncbi:MAG: hypothetical protein LBU92_05075 [Prevotellaceae bacterium]|jgi:hypothetical protein|nr:hypothetical protein [Prevotellaceae bacterium]